MVISFSLGSGRDHRGLTASQESRLSPGRSERQRPGKLAMGWGPEWHCLTIEKHFSFSFGLS
jgi:hypothetical protein